MVSTFYDAQRAYYVLLKVSILVLFFFQVPSFAIAAYRTIEKITIVRDNVFSNPDNLVYAWANRLHRVTRETVVQRELLFGVGDVYDPFLLEESERNLRKIGFLGQVDITPKLTSSGVEIVVHTEDQWTTTAKSYMEMGGNVWWVGGGLSEYNLGGWGYEPFCPTMPAAPEIISERVSRTHASGVGAGALGWTTEKGLGGASSRSI